MSTSVQNMFSSIAKSYDRTNDLLSLGVHRLWRKQSLMFAGVNNLFPAIILDVCCGTGDFCFATKKLTHPKSQVIGLDFVYNMLPIALKKKAEKGYVKSTLHFIQGDALALPFLDQTFDLSMVGFGIRNVDSTLDCLKEMKRVLKKEGKVVVLEFGTPHLIGFREVFKLYSKYIMPIIGGLSSGNREAYEYLPETSSRYPCREDFLEIMKTAGLGDLKYKSFFGGIAYCYVGVKKVS